MGSPLVIDVADVLGSQAAPRSLTQHGVVGEHIGLDMMAFAPDSELTVDAFLTPLGGAVLVDATVSGELSGQCSRCLTRIRADYSLKISEVFAEDPDFIIGDRVVDSDADDASVGSVVRGYVDLTAATVNEAGLVLPFNPVCEDYGLTCDSASVPPPDGVSGEDQARIDPRWSGLEKFR